MTALTSKETLVCVMDTDNRSVKGVTRYPSPMFMGTFQQLGKMRLQLVSTSIFAVDAVISLFKTQKVIMHITQVIKHVAQTFVLWVIASLIFIGSHYFTPALLPIPFGFGRDHLMRGGWNSLPVMLRIV